MQHGTHQARTWGKQLSWQNLLLKKSCPLCQKQNFPEGRRTPGQSLEETLLTSWLGPDSPGTRLNRSPAPSHGNPGCCSAFPCPIASIYIVCPWHTLVIRLQMSTKQAPASPVRPCAQPSGRLKCHRTCSQNRMPSPALHSPAGLGDTSSMSAPLSLSYFIWRGRLG